MYKLVQREQIKQYLAQGFGYLTYYQFTGRWHSRKDVIIKCITAACCTEIARCFDTNLHSILARTVEIPYCFRIVVKFMGLSSDWCFMIIQMEYCNLVSSCLFRYRYGMAPAKIMCNCFIANSKSNECHT